MAKDDAKVRRILQLRMRAPTADVTPLLSFAKAAIPFFEAFGNARVRLLRNVDDPTGFVQQIEYETEAALELNRHQIAGDPMIQGYLQTWRQFFPAGIEFDVYEDVTN